MCVQCVDIDFVQRLDPSDESDEEYVDSTSKEYPSLSTTNVSLKMKSNKSKTVKSPSVQDVETLFCENISTFVLLSSVTYENLKEK